MSAVVKLVTTNDRRRYPDKVASTWSLAIEKHAEAEPLLRQALKIFETQLGKNHSSTDTVRSNLQNLLSDMKSRGGQ